jgi:hypothetical protein
VKKSDEIYRKERKNITLEFLTLSTRELTKHQGYSNLVLL